jgi:hypothetical protein
VGHSRPAGGARELVRDTPHRTLAGCPPPLPVGVPAIRVPRPRFLYLAANPFPGFVGRADSYPFEIVIADSAKQNRWKVGFRLILAIPALILSSVYGSLVASAALLAWFAGLATAKMPLGLRNAAALALRYHAQTTGYLLLLTDSYPYSGPSLNATAATTAPAPLEPAPFQPAPFQPPLPPAPGLSAPPPSSAS